MCGCVCVSVCTVCMHACMYVCVWSVCLYVCACERITYAHAYMHAWMCGCAGGRGCLSVGAVLRMQVLVDLVLHAFQFCANNVCAGITTLVLR